MMGKIWAFRGNYRSDGRSFGGWMNCIINFPPAGPTHNGDGESIWRYST